MLNQTLIFIHLSAAGIALGSLVFCVLVFLPSMSSEEAQALDENSVTYKALNLLAPTVFACALALVLTGIIYLFETYTNQVDLPSGYYNLFGVKMIFVLAVFFMSLYHTFGLRGQIIHLDLRPENRERLPVVLQKMKSLARGILVALTFAIFFGVWLARF